MKRKACKQEKHRKVADNLRLGLTLFLGCGIPLLSLALSRLAGTLATHQQYALAGFAFLLMAAVLTVSLSHLALAVADVTTSGPRASWCLAVSLDLSLVLCELVHVRAGGLGLSAVCYAVMTSVCLASVSLNCWAFLRPHKDRRAP